MSKKPSLDEDLKHLLDNFLDMVKRRDFEQCAMKMEEYINPRLDPNYHQIVLMATSSFKGQEPIKSRWYRVERAQVEALKNYKNE